MRISDWSSDVCSSDLCGCPISYDESLLLACVADASRDARSAFDARLHEMIGQPMRDRMWRAAVGLARMIRRYAHRTIFPRDGDPKHGPARHPLNPDGRPTISLSGRADYARAAPSTLTRPNTC